MKNAIYFILSVFTAIAPLRSLANESSEFANNVIEEHQLTGSAADRLRTILTATPRLTRNIDTENPEVFMGPHNSWHPASRLQCKQKVLDTGLIKANPEFEKICGAKWMAPIPGVSAGSPQICIDQFEFPDIPCEYPVVWLTPPTEKDICETMGKRVCNSDEWEGACAGNMAPPETFPDDTTPQEMRAIHNSARQIIWAFQFIMGLKNTRDTRKVCGVYSSDDPEISEPIRSNINEYYDEIGKSKGCDAANDPYNTCGTNTWPSGFKQDCRSSNDVYDMHGNVAETVIFPPTGGAEHKGSFFVYRSSYPDDCRVRQPFEHSGVFNSNKMAFYQEGFRCCKDVSRSPQ